MNRASKFSKSVMEIITQKDDGLFPKPQEISMKCSCPDFATMCKHVAAVLYGVGATLDSKPEWLFDLRHVDQTELIVANAGDVLLNQFSDNVIDENDLSEIFGIELEPETKKKKPAKTSKSKKQQKRPTLRDYINLGNGRNLSNHACHNRNLTVQY